MKLGKKQLNLSKLEHASPWRSCKGYDNKNGGRKRYGSITFITETSRNSGLTPSGYGKAKSCNQNEKRIRIVNEELKDTNEEMRKKKGLSIQSEREGKRRRRRRIGREEDRSLRT